MTKNQSSKIGQRIAEARRAANLSQRDLARWTGLRQGRISNLESGKGQPTTEELAAIADALSISVTSFMNGNGNGNGK